MTARLLLLFLFAFSGIAQAHDTWVQTNTNVIRVGDNVHIDLMLGNHGNDHRDFKLAGKATLENTTLDVIAPSGKRYEVKDRLIDLGYAPKEGYWTTRFAGTEAGIYIVSHTRESIHAGTRGIKSGKTFFIVSRSLDKVPADLKGFEKPLGHPLEIVPMSSPVAPMGPGQPIQVRVLYRDKFLAGARIAFVPRGAVLSEGYDPNYERITASDGSASYTPTEGNFVLVSVHHVEPSETGIDRTGTKYASTKYSATLTVFVPEVCPCCEE